MPATFLEDEPVRAKGVTFLEDEPETVPVTSRAASTPFPHPLSAAQADMADAQAAAPVLKKINEWSDKPLLDLPQFEQQTNLRNEIGAAVINAGATTIEGLSTPKNLALLPLAAVKSLGRVVAGIFGAHMAGGIPEQIRHAQQQPTLQGRLEDGLGVITTMLFAAGAAKHATGGLGERLKPVFGERSLTEEAVSSRSISVPDKLTQDAPARIQTEPLQIVESNLSQPETSLPRESQPMVSQPPRLLQGEKQGDLISSTQAEPFALKSEKGVDYGEQQRVAEGERAASEQAKLTQEKEQMPLLETADDMKRAESEYRAELEGSLLEHQGRGGDELIDAINAGGGLPAKSSPRQHYAGELEVVRETYQAPRKERISYASIFKKDAPDIDVLTQHLRSRGFDVSTPSDTLNLIETRLRTGKPIYGSEARGAEVYGFGPGAASGKEPLASYEPRRFAERFQEDFKIKEPIREATGNRYYEPIPNKITVADAEKIVNERGIDDSLRLVRDEAFQMEPRVRSTLAQGLIKKLNQSYSEASKAGDPQAKRYLDSAVDTAEYLSELGTRLGQGVQSFAIWSKLTPEGMLESAKRIAKRDGDELAPEVEAKIKSMSEEIQKVPEGFQRDEKTMDLMSYMAEIKGANPSDVPTALWYSNILSGYSTQFVNTLDTSLNILSESVAMAASHPSAAPAIMVGLYRGMVKGGFEAAAVLKTGKSKTGDKLLMPRILERSKFGEKGGVPISTDSATGAFMRRAFESRIATPLNLWKYPLRMMVASDTVLYSSFKEARARVLARAMAKKEGLSGDALFRRVGDILGNYPERRTLARKQATSEGLAGINLERRVNELIEQGRPEELVSAADEAAAIATYNYEPTGALGVVARGIGGITEKVRPLKAIVPFTRIIANVTNRGLDYTPYGYKRLFFGHWGKANEPPIGETYRTQLAKATLGTTAMATIAALDATDKIQITSRGPSDPDERKQLQNSGWKPYSVKIGDTWYNYQYTPVNLGFAMVGHYRDGLRYNKLSEKDAATRLAYAGLKSGTSIIDMSFLGGVRDFIETMSGATSSPASAGKLLARTATSVAVPNITKQLERLFDPTIYQADTVQQALVRETPIARGALLNPMLNALGEPIRYQNRFFEHDTNDPVWKLIVTKQAWVPVPSKTTKIGDQAITPDQYYALIKKSGPQIRDFIESNLDRFDAMEGEQVQDEIRAESERIRREVKSGF